MATELRDQLQAALGSNYAMERELGGGGMSRVFMARDLALDRAVVVKVLSPEYSAGVSIDRFRREIQLIAKLQHPHIVPLLSAGSADGALYYMMPYFGAETLRARLTREGPMPVADCVRLLREVLDALAFAHSHGVIHRDIKPDNILVEARHAIVADFGVAKALKDSANVTSVGIALGTPTYMAPEQAAADPAADHRADLYAVGVVAYEMLSGSPPFVGAPQQVITAHMMTEPTPILQRRSDVPDVLAKLIMRALEKEPKDRPQSAAEMLSALDAVVTPQATAEPTFTGPRHAAGRRWMMPAALAAVIATGGLAAWRFTRPPVMASARSIAIAPFSVATGDSALVRMSQNLVTTISSNLDGVGDIHAADPVSVLNHARSSGAMLNQTDAMSIARKLGAHSVVFGTLTPSGAAVRAFAVLYDLDADKTIARVIATVHADSLAALTDSLTWGLLKAVWSRGTPPTPNVSSITTHNPVALREFLEGERLFSRGEELAAAESYKRAIEADTTFWFAYMRYRLARAWFAMPLDTALTHRLRRHRNELPERERLLATVLDTFTTQSEYLRDLSAITMRFPDYASAWLSLADYHIHHAVRSGHDVREAIEPWRQVVRLMPADQEAANHLAFACAASGDMTCARPAFDHFDSLVRADSARPSLNTRLNQRSLHLGLRPRRDGLVDSMAAAVPDSFIPIGTYAVRMTLAPATLTRAGLHSDWDREFELARREGVRAIGARAYGFLELTTRPLRGDWSLIDSIVALNKDLPAAFQTSPLYGLRARVLAELQQFVPPDARTATQALDIAVRANATRAERVEGRWIGGLNALLRSDSAAFRVQVAFLESDTGFTSRIALRSLRALAAGRAGRRSAAAESLLVLEREHGERAGKVWGAFAADRLVGAQWLVDDGRYAPADSLLRFTRGYIFASTAEAASLIFAPAQLLRSRIAEAMKNDADAVAFAGIFLNYFDLAPPSQKPLIDEAKQRIARLERRDAPIARP